MKQTRIGDITIDAVIEREGPWRRPPRVCVRRYGEGSGALRRTPHSQKHQPACKPGFVGHRRLAPAIRDGHSSGTMFAHGLEQPTRTASLTSPCGVIACANIPRCRPYSVLLPVWFAMPFPLPDPRCALTAPFHPYRAEAPRGEGGRFVLCGTVPGVTPAGRYPAPYVDGARTFLSRSLSTVAGAAVRPTDAPVMGAQSRRVKPIGSTAAVKINYPEDVVWRVARSTGCRRNQPIKQELPRCNIC
jgi:hypothetical protein